MVGKEERAAGERRRRRLAGWLQRKGHGWAVVRAVMGHFGV